MSQFSKPILLLIFNRPDCTRQVIEAISLQKPQKLYIAADGPRKDRTGETEKCEITRRVALQAIDWDCEVKTLFRDENLGCGKAVYQAIDWFFEHNEDGIILEDDCLPGDSFFNYCEELLNKYKDIEEVMHINGSRFQDNKTYGYSSYYFTNYFIPYGWATWRRAWKNFSYNIPSDLGEQFKKNIKKKFPGIIERYDWHRVFMAQARHEVDTWDTQWYFSIYNRGGIGITPVVNLVSNIGFREDATHTVDVVPGIANLPINQLQAITHPKKILVSKAADKYTYEHYYALKLSAFAKFKFRLGKLLPWVKNAFLAFKK